MSECLSSAEGPFCSGSRCCSFMCLRGSPISTHGNYACCSNTETKLARQGVIVGLLTGICSPVWVGTFWGRAGDSHSLLLPPHREGCHLGCLLGRGGEKGKTKALKAIVWAITRVTSHCPFYAGHFMEKQTEWCSFCIWKVKFRFAFCVVFTFLSFQVVLLGTAWLCRFEHHSIWALGSEEQSRCVGNSPPPPMLADCSL